MWFAHSRAFECPPLLLIIFGRCFSVLFVSRGPVGVRTFPEIASCNSTSFDFWANGKVANDYQLSSHNAGTPHECAAWCVALDTCVAFSFRGWLCILSSERHEIGMAVGKHQIKHAFYEIRPGCLAKTTGPVATSAQLSSVASTATVVTCPPLVLFGPPTLKARGVHAEVVRTFTAPMTLAACAEQCVLSHFTPQPCTAFAFKSRNGQAANNCLLYSVTGFQRNNKQDAAFDHYIRMQDTGCNTTATSAFTIALPTAPPPASTASALTATGSSITSDIAPPCPALFQFHPPKVSVRGQSASVHKAYTHANNKGMDASQCAAHCLSRARCVAFGFKSRAGPAPVVCVLYKSTAASTTPAADAAFDFYIAHGRCAYYSTTIHTAATTAAATTATTCPVLHHFAPPAIHTRGSDADLLSSFSYTGNENNVMTATDCGRSCLTNPKCQSFAYKSRVGKALQVCAHYAAVAPQAAAPDNVFDFYQRQRACVVYSSSLGSVEDSMQPHRTPAPHEPLCGENIWNNFAAEQRPYRGISSAKAGQNIIAKLARRKAPTPADCAHACLHTFPGCKSFGFSNDLSQLGKKNSKVCHIYDGAKRSVGERKGWSFFQLNSALGRGCKTATVASPSAAGVYAEQLCPGGPLANFAVPRVSSQRAASTELLDFAPSAVADPATCARKCLADPKCASFAFSERRSRTSCILYEMGGVIKTAGAWTLYDSNSKWSTKVACRDLSSPTAAARITLASAPTKKPTAVWARDFDSDVNGCNICSDVLFGAVSLADLLSKPSESRLQAVVFRWTATLAGDPKVRVTTDLAYSNVSRVSNRSLVRFFASKKQRVLPSPLNIVVAGDTLFGQVGLGYDTSCTSPMHVGDVVAAPSGKFTVVGFETAGGFSESNCEAPPLSEALRAAPAAGESNYVLHSYLQFPTSCFDIPASKLRTSFSDDLIDRAQVNVFCGNSTAEDASTRLIVRFSFLNAATASLFLSRAAQNPVSVSIAGWGSYTGSVIGARSVGTWSFGLASDKEADTAACSALNAKGQSSRKMCTLMHPYTEYCEWSTLSDADPAGVCQPKTPAAEAKQAGVFVDGDDATGASSSDNNDTGHFTAIYAAFGVMLVAVIVVASIVVVAHSNKSSRMHQSDAKTSALSRFSTDATDVSGMPTGAPGFSRFVTSDSGMTEAERPGVSRFVTSDTNTTEQTRLDRLDTDATEYAGDTVAVGPVTTKPDQEQYLSVEPANTVHEQAQEWEATVAELAQQQQQVLLPCACVCLQPNPPRPPARRAAVHTNRPPLFPVPAALLVGAVCACCCCCLTGCPAGLWLCSFVCGYQDQVEWDPTFESEYSELQPPSKTAAPDVPPKRNSEPVTVSRTLADVGNEVVLRVRAPAGPLYDVAKQMPTQTDRHSSHCSAEYEAFSNHLTSITEKEEKASKSGTRETDSSFEMFEFEVQSAGSMGGQSTGESDYSNEMPQYSIIGKDAGDC